MTILGEGWYSPPPVEEEVEPDLTVESLQYEQLMATVNALREALLTMPAPQVTVDAPDLAEIVNAVNGLRPSATADEIGEAIVARLSGDERGNIEPVLIKLTKALETLDFRLKGVGNVSGGGAAPGSFDISDRAERQVGRVTVQNFPATQAVSGPLTNGELRAAPVPVNTGLTPLTDAQLRAAAVPVSTGLTPLTDAQLRASPVPVTAAATLPTTDVFAAKIGQGKARIGGKQVTTSTLNQNAYFTISNPAGNTRNVYVVGFDVYSTSSAAIQYATDFTPVNPPAGTFNPNRATTAPSSAVVYAGTIAYTGATIQPIASQVNANSPLKISLLVILPPGQLLGIQVTGAAVGANISANVFFYEE